MKFCSLDIVLCVVVVSSWSDGRATVIQVMIIHEFLNKYVCCRYPTIDRRRIRQTFLSPLACALHLTRLYNSRTLLWYRCSYILDSSRPRLLADILSVWMYFITRSYDISTRDRNEASVFTHNDSFKSNFLFRFRSRHTFVNRHSTPERRENYVIDHTTRQSQFHVENKNPHEFSALYFAQAQRVITCHILIWPAEWIDSVTYFPS